MPTWALGWPPSPLLPQWTGSPETDDEHLGCACGRGRDKDHVLSHRKPIQINWQKGQRNNLDSITTFCSKAAESWWKGIYRSIWQLGIATSAHWTSSLPLSLHLICSPQNWALCIWPMWDSYTSSTLPALKRHWQQEACRSPPLSSLPE